MIVDLTDVQDGVVVVMAAPEVHEALDQTFALLTGRIGPPGRTRFILPTAMPVE